MTFRPAVSMQPVHMHTDMRSQANACVQLWQDEFKLCQHKANVNHLHFECAKFKIMVCATIRGNSPLNDYNNRWLAFRNTNTRQVSNDFSIVLYTHIF